MTFFIKCASAAALLCSVAALPIPAAAAAAEQARPAQAPASASIEQMEHISVQILGTTGSPIILIPGLASPRAAWDGVAPGLARTHRVYLVQVNGFGGDAPRGNLRPGILDGVVADIHRLIQDRHLENAAVVGHSMGGLVGMMLAARHPDSVGKLMVVDALPFFAATMAPPGTELNVAMVEPQAAQMRDRLMASYGHAPDPAAAEAQVSGMTLHPEYRARLRDWGMAADPRVVAQVLYEDLTTDMRPELARISAPVTIVYAWNDTYPRREPAAGFFRSQYGAVPHISYQDVGPSAHFVMLDQPAQFQAALEGFLAAAPAQ